MMGEVKAAEAEASGHITTIRKQRGVNACGCPVPLSIYVVQDPLSRVLSAVKMSTFHNQGMPEGCLPEDSRLCHSYHQPPHSDKQMSFFHGCLQELGSRIPYKHQHHRVHREGWLGEGERGFPLSRIRSRYLQV